jgi:hypothetical protein
MAKIAIIVGSVRQNRQGIKVAVDGKNRIIQKK